MRAFAGPEKPHTLQQRSIRYTSRRENNLLPGRQIVRIVNLLRILDSHARQPIEHFIGRWHLVFINSKRAWISPFKHFIAAAVMTPSGAPPIPINACMFVPATAAEIPAERSPSEIKRILAPVAHTSAISFLC